MVAKLTYNKQLAALLAIDPYNDFISKGGKIPFILAPLRFYTDIAIALTNGRGYNCEPEKTVDNTLIR